MKKDDSSYIEIKTIKGTAQVVLKGNWNQQDSIPAVHPEAFEDVHSIAFNTDELTGWGSTLLVFVERISGFCKAQDIELFLDGLPNGARGLYGLATAVEERQGARRTEDKHGAFYSIGLGVQNAWSGVVNTMDFIGEVTMALGQMMRGKARFRRVDFLEALNDCGPRALGIVTLISILVGTILAFLGAIQLKMFGAEIYVANLVGIGMFREMGALMTAIIMTGRTGAAFAARLGTMQVNEEVDALKTLAFDSTEFLILPRMLALAIMMPILTVYSNILGMLGGAIVGIGMLGITPVQYLTQTQSGMGLATIFSGLIKSVVFGILVAICGCMNGIRCGRSASAVGDATTKAVVSGIVAIIVADSVLNIVYIILGF